VRLEARCERAAAIFLPRIRGHGDRRDHGVLGAGASPHVTDEVVAVFARHPQVADDDIGLHRPERSARVAGRRDGERAGSRVLEHGARHLAGVLVVVDDQNPHALERARDRAQRV